MLKKRNIRLLRRWSALDWTCREVGEIKMASISGITSFRKTIKTFWAPLVCSETEVWPTSEAQGVSCAPNGVFSLCFWDIFVSAVLGIGCHLVPCRNGNAGMGKWEVAWNSGRTRNMESEKKIAKGYGCMHTSFLHLWMDVWNQLKISSTLLLGASPVNRCSWKEALMV